MEILTNQQTLPIAVIKTDNRLDSYAAPMLKDEIGRLIEDGNIFLIIDLESTDFLDSSGISVLVTALRRTRAQGGDTKLVRPRHPGVLRMFSLTQFDQIFDMAESAEVARAGFQK